MSWHISSLVQNVAILPFNKNHLPHVENRVQKKENTHGILVDSTLNTSFSVSSNCYTITKKEPSIMIIDKSPTLKLFLEMEKDNLFYIFRYDAWWHPNLG